MTAIKVSINIACDEDPIVFEILQGIPKGARRTNRAKQLMYLGAMVERGVANGHGPRGSANVLHQCLDSATTDGEPSTAGAADIFESSRT